MGGVEQAIGVVAGNHVVRVAAICWDRMLSLRPAAQLNRALASARDWGGLRTYGVSFSGAPASPSQTAWPCRPSRWRHIPSTGQRSRR